MIDTMYIGIKWFVVYHEYHSKLLFGYLDNTGPYVINEEPINDTL